MVVYALVGGFAFLLCATLVTLWMKTHRPDDLMIAKVWSIIGGWWIINLLLGSACLAGSNGLIALFFIASLVALWEFLVVHRLSFVGWFEVSAMFVLVVAHYTFIFLELKHFYLFIVPVMTYIYLPFMLLARQSKKGCWPKCCSSCLSIPD
jgi:phosphatidate cytidylyltransferase